MSLAERVKHSARILVVDIERLPGLARVWDQKTRFVHISKFERLPSLLCVAAKWHGSRTTEFLSVWDDAEAMVQRTWELYNEAEIVVTFNGKRFDNKHLRSEWLMAGMAPPKPWKDVDLYQIAASSFGFESKSLNHLCYRLGLETKDGHYDDVLAQQAVDGDAKAQRLMARYNRGDVRITEAAYNRLRGWMPQHPHIGPIDADGRGLLCNQCGSDDLERDGLIRAQVIDNRFYRCRNCGAPIKGTRHSRAAITRGA